MWSGGAVRKNKRKLQREGRGSAIRRSTLFIRGVQSTLEGPLGKPGKARKGAKCFVMEPGQPACPFF